MTPQTLIRAEAEATRAAGGQVYMTSSFQTQSVPLLHIVASLGSPVQVLFIDTGYHFAETYGFVGQLERLLGLDVRWIGSSAQHAALSSAGARALPEYYRSPDACCRRNKVLPLRELLRAGDMWVTGVRRDQTAHRAAMKHVAVDGQGVKHVRPMLGWTASDVAAYMDAHGLPRHPLSDVGYASIGCAPCTVRPEAPRTEPGAPPSNPRTSRWAGMKKTECGLHTGA
ncbi:MAG: phosphoadenylyl-sulfate reductase [Bacteroidetes bacterium CG12_big_fil_rev_8_21_14_0_65_60_17]|nr:MAG: phosphoadenylyl-sulfate reductase [Bacteroidetes bacterium CG12_big_fil_rev_8_21_14_0_65_60_17]